VTGVLQAFIGVSAIELPAVQLLVPSEMVRRATLVVGCTPVTELRLYADDARRLVSRPREGPGRPRPADATENAR
jgi:hypothetical protein